MGWHKPERGEKIIPIYVFQWVGVMLLTLLLSGTAQGLDPLPTPKDVKVKEAAVLLNNQGVEFYYDGRLEEALGSFILASQADPSFAIAHFNCAVVLTTRGFKGDTEEAIRHLEWSHNLDPANAVIREFMLELISLAPLTT